jgi:ectoine hydroxylase-related dioxygenase (phytanoyl-CoA dioxygenase family)
MKLNSDPGYQRFVIDACKPVDMNYGELLSFDPRCVHSTAENEEAHTRISLDFRLIPLDAYDRITRQYQSQGRTRRMFARGDVFYEKSAGEL